ncbi:MAG: metal ABC transporter permease [Verrucomicrobiota bacterium]|nr:metal ABC transporter permease [Verrucomicrobiota bacterium]
MDVQYVFIEPWTTEFSNTIWIYLMGFFVASACGLVGNYLILRRMALVGDAISHSVLPGLAVAFLLSHSRQTWTMFLGAMLAGIVTTLLIEVIHSKSRVKQDAAIGIAFSSLFAIGVILISVFASKVDLDQECVLYGEIEYVASDLPVLIGSTVIGPAAVVRMAGVLLGTVILIVLFYKELLVSSFDKGLALSLGVNSTVVHYALMATLSIVVVSAFESVGAILVIAMLIIPGATAYLLTDRLPTMMVITVIHSALSALMGIHLARWWSNSATAGAMVVSASILFALAWVFSPRHGLIRRYLKVKVLTPEPESI